MFSDVVKPENVKRLKKDRKFMDDRIIAGYPRKLGVFG